MKYGIIHATTASVEPLKAAIKSINKDAEVVNFVNEEMLNYANRNGVDHTAMRMFLKEVLTAEDTGVDAVLVACNIFASRIDPILPFVSVPIIPVDSAMHKKAAEIGGLQCIIGTNYNAVPSCKNSVIATSQELCTSAPEFIECVIPEAASALSAGDTELFDKLLTEKALEVMKEYDISAILLSQVTTARAKDSMQKAGITVPILTTPEEGAKALLALK